MAVLGIALLSAHTIGLERAAGRLVVLPVGDTPLKRHWHRVHRADRRLLPAATASLTSCWPRAHGAWPTGPR